MLRQFLSLWAVFLIGGTVGAMSMWLMAPMSGVETRQILKERFADAQKKASMSVEESQMKARQISDIGRRVIEEGKSSLERGVDEAKSVVMN
jgi:gas vesicle protein